MQLHRHRFSIANCLEWAAPLHGILGWAGVACCLATANPVGAQQIAGDGTLSTNVTSLDNLNFNITAGNQAGGNLFHSFSRFSVPTNGSAFFDNAPNIENIIGRVTGGSVSNIDGLIRANGTANLFLINPSGMLFGPNAQLNIGGSFLGSTANGLSFADGTEFSATTSQTTPLLTVSVPVGLQYGTTAAGINVQGSNLAVQPGRSLALVGGDLTLEGGSLTTESGRIELGGGAGTGTVGLTVVDNQLQLNFPDNLARANISLTDGALVNSSGMGGGDIQLAGRRIVLQDSRVEATTMGSESGGTLAVNASESVELVGNAGGLFSSGLFAETEGNGAAGDLRITTGQLLVRGEARVSAATFGTGRGGNLTVNAADSVELIGVDSEDFQLFTGLLTDAENVGAAGDLKIQTGRLIVRNGAQVSTATFGAGAGGDLTVNATESVELIGVSPSDLLASGLFTAIQETAQGNAGALRVNTGRLIVRDGAQIFAGTVGTGTGGNLTVNAAESVELIGVSPIAQIPSGLFTQVEGAAAKAGDLTVNTGQLVVRDGALLAASTFGAGQGGNLTVNAAKSVDLSGTDPNGFASGLFTITRDVGNAGNLTISTEQLTVRDGAEVSTATSASGNGGSITVKANALEAINGGQLLTTTEGSGRAGDITLKVLSSVSLKGPDSGLFANTTSGSTGDGGDILIDPPEITITDGAGVAVDSQGLGNAGNLIIQAGSLTLDNQAFLSADTASGEGGNITLQLQGLLLLRHNSQLTAEASGSGNGGNITIDTDLLAALEDSDITANAVRGRGGNVQIDTQGLFLAPDSDITASSAQGPQFDGVVEIQTPGIDPSSGLVTLPAEVVDVTGLVTQGCGAGDRQASSEFIVTGRGGLPANPSETLDSDTVLTDLGNPAFSKKTSSSSDASRNNLVSPTPSPIVEAQGWVATANGEVILTAQAPSTGPTSPSLPSAQCHGA